MQGLTQPLMRSNTVILVADGMISAQRAHDQDSNKDQVKTFLLVDYNPGGISMQLQQGMHPIRAHEREPSPCMPSAGSGPSPTPHAVPHQIPPAQ